MDYIDKIESTNHWRKISADIFISFRYTEDNDFDALCELYRKIDYRIYKLIDLQKIDPNNHERHAKVLDKINVQFKKLIENRTVAQLRA